MAMATNKAPAKAHLVMDRLLLLATAAATYPAPILATDWLFGIADAIAMAPAVKKRDNNSDGNQQANNSNGN